MKKLIEAARRVLEEIDLYGMPIPLETVAQLRRAYEEAAQHTLAHGQAVCALPGCLKDVYKSGLCVDHYEPPAGKA